MVYTFHGTMVFIYFQSNPIAIWMIQWFQKRLSLFEPRDDYVYNGDYYYYYHITISFGDDYPIHSPFQRNHWIIPGGSYNAWIVWAFKARAQHRGRLSIVQHLNFFKGTQAPAHIQQENNVEDIHIYIYIMLYIYNVIYIMLYI